MGDFFLHCELASQLRIPLMSLLFKKVVVINKDLNLRKEIKK